LVLGIHVICTFHTWFINVSSTGVESGPFFCSKQKMGRGPPAHAPAVCPRSRDSAVPLPKSAAAITLAHRFRFHPTSLCAEASHRNFFFVCDDRSGRRDCPGRRWMCKLCTQSDSWTSKTSGAQQGHRGLQCRILHQDGDTYGYAGICVSRSIPVFSELK
jgi:hypothetical protein